LISDYLQFCRNFNEFENNLNLPEVLHNVCNNDDNNIELNTYDDLNETENDQKVIKNIGSTKKIFEMFCLANLTSCFPNLCVALKISVTSNFKL